MYLFTPINSHNQNPLIQPSIIHLKSFHHYLSSDLLSVRRQLPGGRYHRTPGCRRQASASGADRTSSMALQVIRDMINYPAASGTEREVI